MIGPRESLGSVKHNIYNHSTSFFFPAFQVNASGILGVGDGPNGLVLFG